MGWRWSVESERYTLRHLPIPPGIAEAAFLGRSLLREPLPEAVLRRAVRLRQVHGAAVLVADAPGSGAEADAAVTDRPGLPLTVRTADCLPVILLEPGGRVGVAHAGWRGLAAGVLEAALSAFADPAGLEILVGPAIGPCCFEVGAEVAERFPGALVPESVPGARRRVDLFAEARRRLLAGGASPEALRVSGICTRCHQHLLPSHRGSDGGPGRLLAVVERRAAAAPAHDR